ncbi:MAG: BBP7 family outer membrane beta-barrel protein [Planctomycetales bacterium]|nr:BBP7 family outer membrane beta-barrel protein [Planctomycetales bacterium]
MEGEIIYESAIVDGSCDAMGGACGCDAIGCDGMGNCGPSCGCSMCGELPSGRAWRPAVTVSLPQDGWISFEGLTMWSDGMDLPPLVTRSPVGTDQADAGVLTRSGTSTLFGGPGNDLFENSRSGWRLQFGFWLDRCHSWGVGADYIDLDRETENFSATSTGDPILARPFFNTMTGSEDSELVALNNGTDIQLTGTVGVSAYTELVGGSFYLRRLTCCDEGCREWLFCGCNGHYCSRNEFRLGYRFMELSEGVRITEELQNNGTTNIGQFSIADQFDTRNQFNGVDLGWSHRLTRGYWTLETLVRLGVGNTRQSITIAGQTTIVDRNDPSNVSTETFDAGLLALSTNSGKFQQNQFSVLPELDLTLGYQLTDHFKATIGYTGIYWSNVIRPGQHIPTDINPDFLPPAITSTGDPRPLFAFDTTDYWVHGLTYGLEYRW